MDARGLGCLVEDASEHGPTDSASRCLPVVDVDHAPTTVAGSEQSFDGDTDLIELAPHAECFERAKSLRLDEQSRAQWFKSRVLLENLYPMAKPRQRYRGRQTGGPGPGYSDVQFC